MDSAFSSFESVEGSDVIPRRGDVNPTTKWHTRSVLEKSAMGQRRDEKEEQRAQKEPFLLTILPFAGLGLVLLAALLWRYLPARSSTDEPSTADREKLVVERWERADEEEIPIEPTDYTRGPDGAPVTIVEYSDFQCPFCRAGASAIRDTLERYPDEVRLVFKNFPLDTACNEEMTQQLHPLACRAALVARCAGKDDPESFWKVHEKMFEAPQLSDAFLESLPAELSLPQDDLSKCVENPATMEEIKADIAYARKIGVRSTPTLYVNGRKLSDYRDGLLTRLVEHVLARADR
jgi:protein-disulfide isomerase